ncbi:MAG: restriction endonuclease subunit S [Planctomycetaceae bacterium]
MKREPLPPMDGTLSSFFEKFELFAAAPHAVAKMRGLILDLASEGKLAEQRSEEGEGELLLTQIRSKHPPSKKGKSKPDEEQAESALHSLTLPSSWALASLGEVSEIVRGVSFPGGVKSAENGEGSIACLRTASVQAEIDWDDLIYIPESYVGRDDQWVQRDDVIISMANSYELVGKVAVVRHVPQRSTFGAFLAAIRPILIEPYFLLYVLRSPRMQAAFRISSSQTTNIANISLGRMRPLPFPLPPLAEQKRIVAKVNELMGLCDRLEEQQRERETRHAALARASLARFTAAPTGDNLDYLFHKSYSISPAELRKAILTLAFRGRLIAQETGCEQDKVILNAGRKPKEKIPKWAKPIEESEKPFQLPPSWTWARLGDVASLKHGYAFESKYFTNEPAPFVLTTPGNFFERGGFRDRESKRKYYTGPVDAEFIFKPGDLIIPMTEQAAGLLGSPAFIPDDGKIYIHNQRLGKLNFSKAVTPEFAFWFFNSDYFRGELARSCTGMKVRHTSPDRVLRALFPVCPLTEQRRIVTKVDQLMALVDQLEAQLTASRETAAKLLDALVAELTTCAPSPASPSIDPTGNGRPAMPASTKAPARTTTSTASGTKTGSSEPTG